MYLCCLGEEALLALARAGVFADSSSEPSSRTIAGSIRSTSSSKSNSGASLSSAIFLLSYAEFDNKLWLDPMFHGNAGARSSYAGKQAGGGSTARQVLQRINRFSLAANLEMEFHPIGSRGPHLGNSLTDFDLLPLPNQKPAVVTVGTDVGIAVFNDHQLAVAP